VRTKKQESSFNDSYLTGSIHHSPPKPVSPLYHHFENLQIVFCGSDKKIVKFLQSEGVEYSEYDE
jgi:hypothetical protein